MRKSIFLPLAAILLLGCWHLATIRAGHDWGDDFALYVSHARNLSEGVGYADTGYIYNPAYPTYSPRTYPPIYPLLMAPLYRLFGMNFAVFKVEQVVLLMLLLAVVYRNIRRELSPPYALGVTILLGASPFLWLYKDRLVSEISFMFFACLALHLADDQPDESRRRRWMRGVVVGLLVYLACGTRAAGIVLLPSVIVADMLRRPAGAARRWRLPGAMSLMVLAVFVCCLAAQKALLVMDGSYLDQWDYDPATPFRNLTALTTEASRVLTSGARIWVRLAVLVPLTGLVLFGYVACLRRRVTARECFVPFYLAMLLIWPVGGSTTRFLLPLLPFVFLYLGCAIERLAYLLPPMRGRLAAAGLVAMIFLSYVALYARLDLRHYKSGVFQAEARELFDFVRERTPADAVVVFSKPRALALFTGRCASPAQQASSDGEQWDHLRHIHATHFIVGRAFPDTDVSLQGFAERYPSRLQVVFRNREFTAYSIDYKSDMHASGPQIDSP